MSRQMMVVMCPSCAEHLEEAGYIVNEIEACESRERCVWCKNRGWYSLYNTRRRETDAEANRSKERTEEGAESHLPISSQHTGADHKL